MADVSIWNEISIHAPGEGSDSAIGSENFNRDRFQSTLPVKGATLCRRCIYDGCLFQSTLPVKGATANSGGQKALALNIWGQG